MPATYFLLCSGNIALGGGGLPNKFTFLLHEFCMGLSESLTYIFPLLRFIKACAMKDEVQTSWRHHFSTICTHKLRFLMPNITLHYHKQFVFSTTNQFSCKMFSFKYEQYCKTSFHNLQWWILDIYLQNVLKIVIFHPFPTIFITIISNLCLHDAAETFTWHILFHLLA